ncbi:SNF2-related protein [Adhaeribacter soli]|uniref:Uncharacterized protein n=1 Tax=Adhaeribacter soli TaxID=2607655 RepID=A0A5N1IMM4_9BACT|nr:SNF2-related protein [Adhaeribacter soli]KAA9325051.1 hypothetical protein F0P94_19290 [Adhaeribacter soli]
MGLFVLWALKLLVEIFPKIICMASNRKKSTKEVASCTGSLFDQPQELPDQERFPINRKRSDLKVGKVVEPDLQDSGEPWIVTGFSSLGYLVKFLGARSGWEKRKKIKLAFGFEPRKQLTKPRNADLPTFEEEAALLEEGFSIQNWSNLFRLIKLLESDVVEARFLDRLHAKIYVGDSFATLGSSNFSTSGLTQQPEANVRVSRFGTSIEASQYEAFKQLAQFFFYEAKPCNDVLVALLKQQLKLTRWQETLARAIAELLERPWYKKVSELQDYLGKLSLWPTQKEGINQALQTLQQHHCVLIADPTGSGKTKLISTLGLILTHWLWRKGHMFRSRIETICPKLVVQSWQHEADAIRFIPRHAFSDGAISGGSDENRERAVERLRQANVLVIDEAHRFLNPDTNRTRQIRRHRADYLILSTATPLSKKPKDLVRIVEILGVDVLPDNQLEAFNRLRKNLDNYNDQDLILLRDYLKHLIVRLTKEQINTYLDANPVAHQYCPDKNCRYPEKENEIYKTDCRPEDISKAEQILKCADNLKGLVFLQKLFKKKYRKRDQTDEQYVANRTGAAKAIAKYKIRALLRSSRAALVEHIAGTDEAARRLAFQRSKKMNTGDMIRVLKEGRDILPETDLKSDALTKYPWLADLTLYQKAVDEELKLYSEIMELAVAMSDDREKGKAEMLHQLMQANTHVLAFDSTLITLDYLQDKFLNRLNNQFICHVPRNSSSQKKVLDEFGFKSTSTDKHLALLSDSMSEGINLPRANVVLMLDMPSVLRLAEQRIGRIDRLNSPFEKVKILWPGDKSPFTLRKDLRLFKANYAARFVYGSNISIPEDLLHQEIEERDLPAEGADFMNSYRKHLREENAIDASSDAFKPVRTLFMRGSGIITPEDYDNLKKQDVRVRTKLSIAQDERGWLFVALKATDDLPPRWYLLQESVEGYRIETALEEICCFLTLKMRILEDWYTLDEWRPEWWESVQSLMNKYLISMQAHQLQHLPPLKERALKKGRQILQSITSRKDVSEEHKSVAYQLLQKMPDPLNNVAGATDPYLCAQQWVDLLRPHLHELQDKQERRNPKSNKLFSFSDIPAKNTLIPQEQIQALLDHLPNKGAEWEQVAACILAVPSGCLIDSN